MDNTQSRNETLVFGLDIGTRSIVGVVGYMERNRFKVIAMAEQKHELIVMRQKLRCRMSCNVETITSLRRETLSHRSELGDRINEENRILN